MFAYIFLVHHECSYVDGSAVVRAANLERAKEILKGLTNRDILRPGEKEQGSDEFFDEKFIEDDDHILDNYPEKLPEGLHSYFNVWCLNARLDLKDPATEGVVAFAYHDG